MYLLRASLLTRGPVARRANGFVPQVAECVRYAHNGPATSYNRDRSSNSDNGNSSRDRKFDRNRPRAPWDMRGNQHGRREGRFADERAGQFGRPSDNRFGGRGSREVPGESEPPPFEPDPREADAPVSGEHLSGSTPFSTIQPHVSDPTYQALVARPLQLKTMTDVQAQVFALLPNLATPPPDVEPNPEAQAGRKDLLIQAKTGTGKTLAFLVPAIEQRVRTLEAVGRQAAIDAGSPGDVALAQKAERAYARTNAGTLIISPTRELATQIANDAIRASANHKEFEVRLFVGGASKGYQMRDWQRGRRDIVVATPGRLIDFLRSEPGFADGFQKTQLLVLDEADTLLEMGFRDDIDIIRQKLPAAPHRQTFLCSATLSREITQVARTLLRPDHTYIRTVSSDTSPVHAHVPQYHTVLPDGKHLISHLVRLIAHDQLVNAGRSKVVVFLSTTKKTQLFSTVLRELAKTNLPASRTNIYELHSKRAQDSRTNTSNMFRYDRSGASVLITSDVSARGVDYPGVTRVIQIGVPTSSDIYIHRVGRTGRAGTSGRGDLILLPWEAGFIRGALSQVPLKPLAIHDLQSEMVQLARDFESDPSKFIRRSEVTVEAPKGHPRALREPATFPQGVPARLETIPESVTQLQGRLDEEAIHDTFASMLGFYVGRIGELGVSKDAVVEGCKAWAVEVMGLPTPPYVSPQFLAKIGVGNNQRSRQQNDRPAFSRDRPSFSRDRPSFSRDRPSFSKDRPSFSRDRPSFSGDRPSFSGDRPSFSRDRSSFGGDRPSFGGDRPSFSRDRAPSNDRYRSRRAPDDF